MPTLQLRINDVVAEALKASHPVVALESPIISHGMPYPQNLHTAIEVEEVVRSQGAVPATIAILDGVPCIGLTRKQLEQLAQAGQSCVKVSRRDLLPTIAAGKNGATTVAATMMLAHAAGIRVFVTGGIGGVHRGVHESMDISADLTELSKTPVAVVCAGVKSILDIPKTLEYLETSGVTVAGYRTDEFPAFYTPHSGCKAHCRMDDHLQIAKVASMLPAIGSDMVLGVPIPTQQAAAAAPTQAATEQALSEARAKGLQGAAVTPFLLDRVRQLTGGKSLEANIALIKNNARVGAQLAAAVSDVLRSSKL
eukprot:TRINITY_DN11046_c0_g1_i1.p1 TRINITY_DN11046_c0_g1~~TRINITY_DN11046_c0_g1_i1.p1  ORF type:complete len:310 (+),score=31.11 TRINITY_DN11046_c0_g1_i1:252-1181(+)